MVENGKHMARIFFQICTLYMIRTEYQNKKFKTNVKKTIQWVLHFICPDDDHPQIESKIQFNYIIY